MKSAFRSGVAKHFQAASDRRSPPAADLEVRLVVHLSTHVRASVLGHKYIRESLGSTAQGMNVLTTSAENK